MEWRNAVRHSAEATEIRGIEAISAVGNKERSKDAQGAEKESQGEAINSRDSARV